MTHKSGIAIIATGLLFVSAVLSSLSFAQDQDQALIKAAIEGDVKQVQDLLDKGADVNAEDENGWTALAWAINTDYWAIHTDYGDTALMEAADKGHLEVVKLLLEKGADVNAKDENGNTALDLAWKDSHPKVEQILRAHGASGAQSVYERDGKIFLRNSKGQEIQLTSSGHDSAPSLSPNGALLVFVRGTSKKPIDAGFDKAEASELWVLDIGSKKAERVLSSKDSNKEVPERLKEVLAGFSVPQFSQDSKSIYFLSAASMQNQALHRLDLITKEVRFVAWGNSLKVIGDGEHVGHLKVNQKRGAHYCDYVLTPEGKEIKVIEDSCD